jgi:Protein of unknown function (DUF2793)
MSEESARLALPLLAPGQAQKEMTHNEALTRLDIIVQSVVVAVAPAAVPADPQPGQCWIVGAGASGVWQGQDGALAAWTEGGWRFVPAFDGMAVWSLADGMSVTRRQGQWETGALDVRTVRVGGQAVLGARQPPIAEPIGGAIVDSESRATVAAILAMLRSHGLIAR